MTGKHRTPEGEKSTSEQVQGERNDASQGKHRRTGPDMSKIFPAGDPAKQMKGKNV